MAYWTKSQITSRAQARAHAVLRRRHKEEYDLEYQKAKAELEEESRLGMALLKEKGRADEPAAGR